MFEQEILYTTLRKDIEYLSTLAECPDIDIKESCYEFDGISYKAQLTLPSGQIVMAEKVVDASLVNDNQYIEQIKDCLLTEVGALFIKNAYKKRTANEVTMKVDNYYSIHKSICEKSWCDV